MKITDYSKNRLLKSMAHWEMPKEFADPMFNYLVYGFNPGGCFTSALANDFYGTILRSHPANTIQSFKALAGWIRGEVPKEAWGSYAAVDDWCYMKAPERRAILERDGLIYTADVEVMMCLKGKNTHEPILWEQ